jgi:hypothetical protein
MRLPPTVLLCAGWRSAIGIEPMDWLVHRQDADATMYAKRCGRGVTSVE